jgi:hypothetical protein
VRYAFSNIHRLGWDAANAAPGGVVAPPGAARANGMVFDRTDLPLKDKQVVYVGIKPQHATTFSQIAVPLRQGK